MSTNNDEKFKFSPLEIVGGYTLVRPLGKGYRSEVWLGQKENKREEEEENKPENVAVKIFTGSVLDKKSTEKFLQEGVTLQKFDHYNIVTVIDFGIDTKHGGIPYIIMRKEGKNLREAHPEGIDSLKKVVSYVNKIAAALLYAHGRGVIHRDIKPTNILQIDPLKAEVEDSVRVSDFGIAALATNSPQNEGLVGYYAYMAPEQDEGRAYPESDQYALAVMVYEWLCGALPFTGTSKELTRQHKSTPPPSLCERNPNISPAVEAVVMKALSKKPEDRHGNIVQFAQALEAAALSSPPSASKPRQAPKPTRRWVLLALLLATVLTLIDRAVESWSSPRAKVVQPHPSATSFEQQSEVETIAWSSDSKRIASSGIDGNIRIWDIATQRQTIQPYKQGSRVLAMMWLSDNKRIASLSVDGMLHIWNSFSGKLYLQYRRMDISNDGSLAREQVAKWAATGDLATSLGTTALVYDFSTSRGFTLPDITFAMHSSRVKALGFSSVGDMIASCDSDGIVWVWNPENARPVLPPYQGHTSEVLSVDWQPQPKSQSQPGLIASGDRGGVVQIWHCYATPTANAGELYASYGHTGPVYAVAWSPDGQYLVSGGADHVALVWKKSNRSISKYNGHTNSINVIAVSPNGKLVATGSVDETVQVWKL